MNDEKELKTEIGQLADLKLMVRAYGEIAAMRMQKTRDWVLYSRRFLNQLNKVFEEVRLSYFLGRGVAAGGRRKKGAITFLPHNGRNVAVFLSANSRLYGDLLNKTFSKFLGEVRARQSEATIVGRAGMAMFRSVEPHRPVTYFDLPDDRVDMLVLQKLSRHLVPYEEVRIYFGRYEGWGSPETSELVMSSKIEGKQLAQSGVAAYLYEPSHEEVLKFFEKEIFGSLLSQSVRESQLAKFAARLLAMNSAEVNIAEKLKGLGVAQRRVHHNRFNQKQANLINSLVGRGVV